MKTSNAKAGEALKGNDERVAEEITYLEISLLEDDSSQTRFELDDATVREYAARMLAGETFDPIIAYFDGTRYFRATGGHRLAAHRLAGLDRIATIVRSGTQWDAISFGIADNQQHRGRPLTTADKRHNTGLVLRVRPDLSDRAIAQIVGVNHSTVAKHRRALEENGEISHFLPGVGRGVRTRQNGPDDASGANDGANPNSAGGRQGRASEHCSCGGKWTSDGHGKRFCEACHYGHPWDEYPLPNDLEAGYSYSAPGENDECAHVDVFPDGKYCYVSILTLSSTPLQVFGDTRGRRCNRKSIQEFLQLEGFVPIGTWDSQLHVEFPPSYIPTEQERWEMDSRKYRHLELTGRFPEE